MKKLTILTLGAVAILFSIVYGTLSALKYTEFEKGKTFSQYAGLKLEIIEDFRTKSKGEDVRVIVLDHKMTSQLRHQEQTLILDSNGLIIDIFVHENHEGDIRLKALRQAKSKT